MISEKELVDVKRYEAITEDLMANSLMDLFFKHVYHFSTIFDSADALTTATTGAGSSVTVDGSGITLTTDTSANDKAEVYKSHNKNPASWREPQRFQVSFRLNQVTDQTIYLVRGGDPADNSKPKFGLKIVNATLFGVCARGSSESTSKVQDLSANTTYHAQAWLVPGDKAIILLRNTTTNEMEQKTVITTDVPRKDETVTDDFFRFFLRTDANAAKTISIGHFQYAQIKDKSFSS